ncbi:hypothetical protein PILCRDRAFT_349833 [Piloderma croceum F 1598]|uniref:Peroxisomal membrane protein PEX16 n=1 Tax=Piloderma croceum (strain F 1598) TaxID=765440 RepID=A0A0C3BFW2_PILCF|nr:hypothetical protein PILCRDRAFT_349833 [Piloderma croceum F 1598]
MSSSVARYESFLINNVSTISTLESSLRSVTWFLPGRFKDAELASEALSASLNVMSLYHDTLLAKIAQNDPKYKPLIPTSLHTRYTRAWSDKNPRYKWAARALELIRFTELLVEMGLRRKVSSQNKWRAIVSLEVLKALLRLVLLRITRRPLLAPPIPERDFDPASLPTPSNTSSPTLAPSSPSSSPPATPDHIKNNHVPLPPHPLLGLSSSSPSDLSVEEYLLPKALTTSAVKPSTSLVRTLSSPIEWLSEIIYILRPLIYATLSATNKGSSRPLITALIMEMVSRNLRRAAPAASALERVEYSRRDRDMLCPKIDTFADKVAHVPLLGLFGALVKDWMPLIDEYYYCSQIHPLYIRELINILLFQTRPHSFRFLFSLFLTVWSL